MDGWMAVAGCLQQLVVCMYMCIAIECYLWHYNIMIYRYIYIMLFCYMGYDMIDTMFTTLTLL
jgi:hypothetical protein